MDLIFAIGRVALVLGLLVLTLRLVGRSRGLRAAGSARSGGRGSGAVEILDQTRVGRTASIVTLRLGDRGVAIAVTDQQVTVIGDIDLTVDAPDELPAAPSSASVTLRTGLDVLRERTIRR